MAKLKIYTFPDIVLAQKALPLERVGKDKEFFKFADDMLETMYEAPGVGLAANQVGVLKRVLVLDTDYSHETPLKDMGEEEEEAVPPSGEVIGTEKIVNRNPMIMINPEIVHQEGSIVWNEGCLSVPEYSADVKRAEKIKVRYTDIDGLEKTLMAEGLMAVCVQHELDHLNGKLFIERLSPLKRDFAKKKLLKERNERDSE